ncbi:MAG: enoyl-CoA hydratase/isomerase family protein [Pseudomonadota bacterium]
MDGEVRFAVEDRVGVITLDRPAALNALRRDMVKSLRDTLTGLDGHADVRAVMIIGEGRAFCAGVDLNEAESDVGADDLGIADGSLEVLQEVTDALRALPVPTIAALNGLAVGMGSEISIACDIRIAAKSAYLWFSESKRSLFQSNGVMYLLPRLIGHSRSIEWMMSARKIRSKELDRSGLVAHVFADEGFRQAALGYASRIAANSPLSLRLLKEVSRSAFDASLEEVMRLEVEGMKETLRSEYIKEGLRAFAEKRDPVYD